MESGKARQTRFMVHTCHLLDLRAGVRSLFVTYLIKSVSLLGRH